MAVGGDPENRKGIILAKNEMAKKYKIQTAETIWQAKKKCPDLVIVPPRHDLYEKYSIMVNEIYQSYTDLVEKFGIDESWLVITGSEPVFGDGKKIADTLRERVKKEIGLTISVGVSFNKIFAKLGSDYKKPDATTLILRDNYKEIVYPLPASSLLFVGKKATEILAKANIKTIGDIANTNCDVLRQLLGKQGEQIHIYACGEDNSPVKSFHDEADLKSVGNGMTFKRNLIGEEDIKLGVIILSDSIATRMRHHGVKCTTVRVMIKNPELKTISRQKTLLNPTHLAGEITPVAMDIIKESWDLKKPIRMLTITGSNLVKESQGQQISLFDESAENFPKIERLERAIDEIRNKYGWSAVHSAGVIENDIGIATTEKKY